MEALFTADDFKKPDSAYWISGALGAAFLSAEGTAEIANALLTDRLLKALTLEVTDLPCSCTPEYNCEDGECSARRAATAAFFNATIRSKLKEK